MMTINECLQNALDHDKLEIARELLNHGADANYEVEVEIHGSFYKAPLVFIVLRGKGVGVNTPAIHVVDKLSLLFDYGADINYRSKVLGTPLECTHDYVDDYVSLFLLRQGANPFLRECPDNFNFFEMSLNNNNTFLVEEIMRMYPEESQKNLDEYIFDFANDDDVYNILPFVLERGADPFKPNGNGRSFFEHCVIRNKFNLIDKILTSPKSFVSSLSLSFVLDNVNVIRYICERLVEREDKDEILKSFHEEIKMFGGRKEICNVMKEI